MEKQEILAIYGTEYKQMTKTLLQEADLEGRILSKECKIGIKPNLVAPSEASYGATTHSEIVAGIIEYLQERGFSNLVMLESSWVGDKTAEAAEVCGYYELSERYHVPFIDLQKDTYQTYSCQGMELSHLFYHFIVNKLLKFPCAERPTARTAFVVRPLGASQVLNA